MGLTVSHFIVFQPSISQEKIAFLSHDKCNLEITILLAVKYS